MDQSAQSPLPRQARLLVVQHNQFAARSLARYLGRDFDSIEIALDLETAESMLADPQYGPTHLVCGHNFGPGSASGAEAIRRWRPAYRQLVRVVLATSQTELPDDLPGVDAVFVKPASPATLRAALVEQ